MEHRLDTELDAERDYPPEWWDGQAHTPEYYELKEWIAEQERWLEEYEDWLYCACDNLLSKYDTDTGEDVCGECR